MKDLYNYGYKLYIDNWYSSAALFRLLERNGTVSTGTAKPNHLKSHLPEVLTKPKLAKGMYRFRRDSNL